MGYAALRFAHAREEEAVDITTRHFRFDNGLLANAAEKTKADKVARGVDGVKNVRSQLTITASGGNGT